MTNKIDNFLLYDICCALLFFFYLSNQILIDKNWLIESSIFFSNIYYMWLFCLQKNIKSYIPTSTKYILFIFKAFKCIWILC